MINSKRWLIPLTAFALLLIMTNFAGAQDSSEFDTVTGTVSYLQRIALPDSAEVVIELADVSRADARAKVLASQRIIANGRQVPFNFALSYETASIQENGTYTVRAQIYVDGELQWTSDTAYPVITNGESSADITLVQVSESNGGETDMAATFGTVTGTVSYLQRIALPPEAVVLVELSDVSRADAPAFVLASQQFIANGRQVPFPFSLNYVTASIKERGMYTISAKIFLNGKLAWITDTHNAVISNGVFNIDVVLTQVTQ